MNLNTPLRRLLVLLLCLSMMTGLVLPAFAADAASQTPEPNPAEDFKFSNGVITEYLGNAVDVVIPAKINGTPVTKLDDMCIGASKTAVESLVIPSTVTTYGDYVFDYQYSLTNVYFYGAVPANFAESLANSIFDGAISDSELTIHCKSLYADDFETAADGAVSVSADIADELPDPAYPEAPSHHLSYTDNGDGTHSAVCTDEGCDYTITNEAHAFEKGICVCGAKVDPSSQEYYNFELRDGKAWITGYKGFGGEITLPSTYTVDDKTYDVVGVAEGAFCGNGDYFGKTDSEALSRITKITVPASITTVEKQGFYYVGRYMTRMWQLKEIVFEAENVTFGTAALGANPNLTAVTLPAKQEALSSSMFVEDTALTAIVLPETINTVGAIAFSNCTGLISVTFRGEAAPGVAPYSVYNSTRYPFYGCSKLTVYVPAVSLADYQETWNDMLAAPVEQKGDITLATWGEEPVVASIPDFKVYVDGTTASSENPKYLEFHVTSFDNAAKTGKVELKYVGYNDASQTLVIPASVTAKVIGRTWTFAVTGIGASAIYSYQTTGSSSDYYFSAVSFPDSLEYISAMGCWGLRSVTELDLSDTKLQAIGSDAFSGCKKVEAVKLPATLEKMGKDVQTSVGEGENTQVVTYTENVFAGCDALQNIYVDAENPNFKDVDGVLFTKNGKKLIRYPSARPETHYDIPEGVEVIASQAFMQTYLGKSVLSTVSFPSTLKRIDSLAFRQSNLTSVTLPANVTFGSSAFDLCKKLTSVTISEGVEALSDYMFWSCESLGAIVFPASLKTVGSSCFGHTGLPSVELNQVETIGSYAFYYCDNLTALTVPATLSTIGTGAFCNNANLAKVTFADGCKKIGDYMFFYNGALTDLTLVDSIESIGNAAFGLCVGLSEVTMPKGLKEMGTGVFYQDWSNLTKVVFPDEVQITELPANTFESCQALTYVYLGKNIAATAPVSLYDTNAALVVDCAVAEERFQRSPFDVFAYDFNNKELFAKYEAQDADSTGYPVYKVWLTQAGESGGCGGGGATITEDGYTIAYLCAGATPAFRYGNAKPAEPVVLTVLEQYEGKAAATVKTYTMSDLKALAENKTVGYQYWNHKTTVEGTVASNLYASVDSLLADAGIDFGAGDSVTASTAEADFTSTLTYEDSKTKKYYINETGAVEVPAAILISWNSGTGTPEEIVKGAYISGNLRFAYGITQEQYDGQNASGKRIVSKVASVTVIHAAACTHPTTEVVNAKPATCTENGYTGDLVCTVCGAAIGQGEVIPANCPGARFTDLPAVGSWAHEGIDFAVKHDLFRGTSETTFEPETAMDRAMLVTVLWRLAGQPASNATVPFTDVSAKGYYADALAWAFENGVVRGVTETTFEPESVVTREQITAILFRYAGQRGYDVSGRADLASFSDAGSVKAYAKDAMAWAVSVKLIKGTDNGAGVVLDPEGNATRAQVATLLMRFAESFTK